MPAFWACAARCDAAPLPGARAGPGPCGPCGPCGARPDSFPGLIRPHALAQHPDALAPLAAPDCAPVDRRPLVPCLAAFERFGAARRCAHIPDRSSTDTAPRPLADTHPPTQQKPTPRGQRGPEQANKPRPLPAHPRATRVSEPPSRNLSRVHELLKGIKARTERAPAGMKDLGSTMAAKTAKAAPTTGQADPAELEQIGALLGAIDADTDTVLADFAAQRQALQTQQVSAEILARHDQTQGELKQRANELRGIIGQWRQARSAAVLGALYAYFERYPAARVDNPVDPAKLPWSNPPPNQRLPAESRAAWWRNLHPGQAVKLAQAGGGSTGIEFRIPPEPGLAPRPEDLAETPEVTLTPDIRAKALELKNNPVVIHNWVRNHIEWVPTWGAIQSAQDTLDKRRGNAVDIASLQIALLRAAGIPA